MSNVKVIHYGSAEYEQELKLRNKVLREPLGMQLTEQELSQDKDDIHIAAFFENALVGCLLLKPLSKNIAKMRQVAVDPALQGKGIGRLLVDASEAIARDAGFLEIHLNARESAVPFYVSLGYRVDGEKFEEVGIAHFKMKKTIKKGA